MACEYPTHAYKWRWHVYAVLRTNIAEQSETRTSVIFVAKRYNLRCSTTYNPKTKPQPQCLEYGICKIVPPSTWKPRTAPYENKDDMVCVM